MFLAYGRSLLRRIRTELAHVTGGAIGVPCETNRPAVSLKHMTKADFALVGHKRVQIQFDLVWVGLSSQAQAL